MFFKKKKTEVQKVYERYSSWEAQTLLQYYMEYLFVAEMNLTQEEKREEFTKQLNRMSAKDGLDMVKKFNLFCKSNANNPELMKEIVGSVDYQNKKEMYLRSREKELELERLQKYRENVLTEMRNMCAYIVKTLDIDEDACMNRIDEAINASRESDSPVPDGNIKRNAYILVFNSIVLELCEKDYRFDGFILNSEGTNLEDKLGLILRNLQNEGYESENTCSEMLRNAFERIRMSNQRRDSIDELVNEGKAVFDFEDEYEKKLYEEVTGEECVWLHDGSFMQLFKKAFELYDEKKYGEALEVYQKCLLRNPVSIRTMFEIYECYFAMEMLDSAYKALYGMKEFLRKNEDIGHFYRSIGYIEKERNNYLLAYACLSYSLQFNKNNSIEVEVNCLLVDIRIAAGHSLELVSPVDLFKSNNIPVYEYVQETCTVQRDEKFWNSVQKLYLNLYQDISDACIKQMASTGNVNSYMNNTVSLDINSSYFFEMYLVEALHYLNYVFMLSLEQLCDDLLPSEKKDIENFVAEQMECYYAADGHIPHNRMENYVAIGTSDLKVGYSVGCVTGTNTMNEYSFDFMRKKASLFFSDIIWHQDMAKHFLSFEQILKRNKQFGEPVTNIVLENLKRSGAVTTYNDVIYQVLERLCVK